MSKNQEQERTEYEKACYEFSTSKELRNKLEKDYGCTNIKYGESYEYLECLERVEEGIEREHHFCMKGIDGNIYQ